MHDHHRHHGHHHPGNEQKASDGLIKLQVMLEHWIEHSESHGETYREWATKARAEGEDGIAREINLALDLGDEMKKHFQRAKAIAAAKLVLPQGTSIE